jgi:photosystem II stability/assembly factor-like uncharacterized protein
VVEIMSTTEIPGAPDDLVRVFVSYAREDRRWLDPDYRFGLIPFLMESLRRHRVVFWFDKELKPGDEFGRLILSQIEESQIALLIVSQNFLNSEFIENREMPRIAERARLGQMIVVPVLVEPCDWSEYPFLADRQMVPSSPLIEYTESEPQWAKVRFQILDGLKAQLKRIREAPQSHVEKVQTSVPEEIQPASQTSAESHASEVPRPTPETGNAVADNADLLRVEREAHPSEPVLPPAAEPIGTASEDRTITSTAAEQKKPRNRLKQVIAVAAGAILVIALVMWRVYMSHGTPWTACNSGTSAYLDSIFATSDGNHLWAVGANGTIVQSDDGGATWVVRYSSTTNVLTSIFGASDGQRLWAVGGKGTIVESVDGGVSWSAGNSGVTNDLFSIFGTGDGKRLWAVGSSNYPLANSSSTILESDDAGASWLARKSGTTIYLNSIVGTSDGKRLWAVGMYGTIMESDDAGANWMARKSGVLAEFESIFRTGDGGRLWAVGKNGTVVDSDNEGVAWTAHKIGTESDLYSIFGTSDGQHLWIVGDKGTIEESADAGETWKALNSGTTLQLNSIIGSSDGQHLWVVGDNGTILEPGH